MSSPTPFVYQDEKTNNCNISIINIAGVPWSGVDYPNHNIEPQEPTPVMLYPSLFPKSLYYLLFRTQRLIKPPLVGDVFAKCLTPGPIVKLLKFPLRRKEEPNRIQNGLPYSHEHTAYLLNWDPIGSMLA